VVLVRVGVGLIRAGPRVRALLGGHGTSSLWLRSNWRCVIITVVQFKGAPLRLPTPRLDQFPVRVLVSPLYYKPSVHMNS